MALNVAPEHEAKIRALIESGRFDSVDAVVGKGLRLLDLQQQNQEKLERLRALIDEGDEGEGEPLTRESWDAALEKVRHDFSAKGTRAERIDAAT